MTLRNHKAIAGLGLTAAVLLGGWGWAGAVDAGSSAEQVVSVRLVPRSSRTTTPKAPATTVTTEAPATTVTTQAPATTVTTKALAATTTKAPATTATTKAPAPVATTAPAPVTTVAPVPSGLTSAQRTTMLNLVNAKRTAGTTCGGVPFPAVPALSLQADLNEASDSHALDMATRNYFSHTGANGSDPGNRMTAAGYSWSAWAENIAAGQTTPESVIAALFGSEGHCHNFMSSAVTQIGFGRAQSASSDYGNYWVADLGRPA